MNSELWSKWSAVHDMPDQKKRLASSKQAACTPVQIDRESGTAHFKGSRGSYETTLERCSCVDFFRRGLPCKHMYRLAIETGLVNETAASYLHGGYSWKQVIEIIEKYPEKVQQEFMSHFSSSCKSASPYRRMKRPEMEILIADGHLREYPEKETAKYKTVRLIEDFMVDRQKVHYYFSRKFSSPSYYFDGVEMAREPLPEDEVTAFLRERGFVE